MTEQKEFDRNDDYDEIKQQYPDFDPVVQMQIDSYTEAMRRATMSDCCIGICENDKAMQISINTQGPDRRESEAHALTVLIQAAAGAVEQRSGGTIKMMIHMDSGEVLPALPENIKAVMGRRP